MHQLTAFRPLVAAGAAAVGASLIALTPAVSNNVAADLHRSAAAAQQRAVQLLSTDDPGVVNPIQTWINVFTDSAANLQADYASATAYGPFPVLEQLLANQATIEGVQVIPAFQASAGNTLSYYTGVVSGDFFPDMVLAFSEIQGGNFPQGFAGIGQAGIPGLASSFGPPLQGLLPVLPGEAQNLPNAIQFALGSGYYSFAINYWLTWPTALGWEFGTDVQNAYDGFASGDVLAGVTNLLNIPGAFTGQFLNGGVTNAGFTPGLLSPPDPTNIRTTAGLLAFFTTYMAQGTANSIVYSDTDYASGLTPVTAPNIVQGGDLAATVQHFLGQVSAFTTYGNLLGANGWLTPASIVDSLVNLFQTYAGVGGLSAAATGASAAGLAGIAPSIAANVAGVAPSIAADLSGLAPSIAADLSGIAPSIATNLAGTLAPEFGTLAAHLLTSLF